MAQAQQKAFKGWWNADMSSVNIAPLPENEPRAIVQIYAARAYGWRGYVAVHSWIATKDTDAKHYDVYQVIGWRQRRNLSVVSIEPGIPDRKWYGSAPELLYELKASTLHP